jgi:DNA-binding MarR family transcriptional regulator
MTEDLSPEEYFALAELRYQIRRFLRFSDEEARRRGLQAQQHQLLLAVKGFGARSIAELAERLQLRHHSVVGLINRLAARGLVERCHEARDKRQVGVRLTGPGELLLRQLSIAHRAELQSAAPALARSLSALTEQAA